MRHLLNLSIGLLGLSLAGCGGGPPAVSSKEKAIPSDLEQLQGAWKLVGPSMYPYRKTVTREPVDTVVWIKGDKLHVILVEKDFRKRPVQVEIATLKLDPKQEPKTVDLALHYQDFQKQLAGIYSLQGDRLEVCLQGLNAAHRGPRPKEFKQETDYDLAQLTRVPDQLIEDTLKRFTELNAQHLLHEATAGMTFEKPPLEEVIQLYPKTEAARSAKQLIEKFSKLEKTEKDR